MSHTIPKRYSAVGISRMLGKRFKRSQEGTTRIRGWHNWTEGYVCCQSENYIYISYRASSNNRVGVPEEYWLDLIMEHLISKNIPAHKSEAMNKIIIHRKKD